MSTELRRCVALTGLALGCSGPQRTASHPLRPLAESRAIEVVMDAVRETGATPELHRTIQLAGHHVLEIDVATAGRPHGIEFVTAQDRADSGSVLPTRTVPGSLRTVQGAGTDATTDVLLLDDREFLYEPEADLAGADRPTAVEIEDRLRRAVIDYLTYLRQHGEM